MGPETAAALKPHASGAAKGSSSTGAKRMTWHSVYSAEEVTEVQQHGPTMGRCAAGLA